MISPDCSGKLPASSGDLERKAGRVLTEAMPLRFKKN